MRLDDSVQCVKGVGEARRTALNRLGIISVRDLIQFFPRDYLDRSAVTDIAGLRVDEAGTIRARVCPGAEVSRSKNMYVTKIRFEDGSGTITALWFNQPYLKSYFNIGGEFMLTGEVSRRGVGMVMLSPDYEPVSDEQLSTSRIVPVYSLRGELSQKQLRKIVHRVLKALDDSGVAAEEYLPERIREGLGLAGLNHAIKNIHFPENAEAFFQARKRLVFDEILLLRMALNRLKEDIKQKSSITMRGLDYSELAELMPYKPTAAQERVIGEIAADFNSGLVMNRLIQGDVGSGKTAVACVAAYIAIKNGYQAALMVPTEVLAAQHYKSIKKFFDRLGIATDLLIGALNKNERERIYSRTRSGDTQMLIGTHAVIQEGVRFHNLALTITDEQHRFGVRQRALLSEKGARPHALAMSATPIPRTLALVLYGDMDISIIDELPPGRSRIDTYAVGGAYRQRYWQFIRSQLEEGRQAYVICAATGINEDLQLENEDLQLENVIDYAEKLGSVLTGYRVSFLHGKMNKDEKERIMGEFVAGGTHVLVSTTVIEVGIDVPNATVIVIENADRFGLAQLHQLRGRVGRGAYKSYCVLVSDSRSETSKERMKIMAKTNDGFVISEKDLQLRGQGDFFGTRQHGLPDMKIANIYKDMDMLPLVEKAFGMITCGDTLSGAEACALSIEIDRRMKGGFQTVSI